MSEQILRNAARCLVCSTSIESKHRHDFVSCRCGAIFIDGGRDYLRRGGDMSVLQEESITAPVETRTHVLENSGQIVRNVHHSKMCEGGPCTIHNRSGHPMRDWPQYFTDTMVRVCDHGVAHMDPDTPLYRGCLSCDGCCREDKP